MSVSWLSWGGVGRRILEGIDNSPAPTPGLSISGRARSGRPLALSLLPAFSSSSLIVCPLGPAAVSLQRPSGNWALTSLMSCTLPSCTGGTLMWELMGQVGLTSHRRWGPRWGPRDEGSALDGPSGGLMAGPFPWPHLPALVGRAPFSPSPFPTCETELGGFLLVASGNRCPWRGGSSARMTVPDRGRGREPGICRHLSPLLPGV